MKRPPLRGPFVFDADRNYLVGVVAVVEVLVVVVEVVAVLVVAVPVVAVPVVPVSCTTAGASDFVSVVVVVVSFFWQPTAKPMLMTATRPRVWNFFINLISFF
jgi:hypothetical protein